MRSILLTMLMAMACSVGSSAQAAPVVGTFIDKTTIASETFHQIKVCGWRCTYNHATHKKVCWDPCQQRKP